MYNTGIVGRKEKRVIEQSDKNRRSGRERQPVTIASAAAECSAVLDYCASISIKRLDRFVLVCYVPMGLFPFGEISFAWEVIENTIFFGGNLTDCKYSNFCLHLISTSYAFLYSSAQLYKLD